MVPVGAMVAPAQREVVNRMLVQSVAGGATLFCVGDEDPDSLFLVQGSVDLTAEDGESRTVAATDDAARYALAALKPRRFEARTRGPCLIARINSSVLDKMVGWDQLLRGENDSGYQVEELDLRTDRRWLSRLMQNEHFRRLPVASLQQLVARMQTLEMEKGTTVVRQGDEGDSYYFLASGRALVARQSDEQADTIEMAVLGPGEGFGEEALLSGQPRNASVTLMEDSVLVCLGKEEFSTLLNAPLMQRISAKEAADRVRDGAGLLDVRMESEFESGSLKGARNIPLYLLRLYARKLDKQRPWVVFCDNGSRSAAAAFLLGQDGFEALVLDGGLAANKRLEE
ncbi:MAG: cyclic nucleotide-binding domain-containing protein [Gammaproteobacteria bacterium]|nr:cyclic nucleotide-binding domain-containing protein [Gammaproteobacteria bacterium]